MEMGQIKYFAEALLTAGGDTQLHLSSLRAVGCCGRVVQALLQLLHPRDQLRNAEATRTSFNSLTLTSQPDPEHRLKRLKNQRKPHGGAFSDISIIHAN